MVLHALNRYYDILTSDPDSGVAPPGYCSTNISFALNLSPQGELLEIIPLLQQVQRGKKTVEIPQRMIVPEAVKRSSGISSNALWDNCAYVLGISDKDENDPEYSIERHKAFCQLNESLLNNIDCPEAKAVIAFLEHWDIKSARAHPAVVRHLDALLKGGNLVFKLDGQHGFVPEVKVIRDAWDAYKSNNAGKPIGQCLVTGEMGPITILHPSLKGIKNTNSTGALLVSFNERAYESYNRTQAQGLNSPVSEKATFAYTTVLNYLLSQDSKSKKINLGDATVVYWADSADITYTSVFQGMIDPDWFDQEDAAGTTIRDSRPERLLADIAEKVRKGEPLDVSRLKQDIDIDTRFYVLGLSPNAARVSVRFFYSDPFIKFIQRIMKHHEDMNVGQRYPVSLWRMLNETVSQKASDKTPAPLMAGAVMRSILTGAPYPAALFNAIITRIRADADDEQKKFYKVNATRAGILKAYLTRKYRNLNQPGIKEVLCMSLNEQSTNQAYLLGRLFAVLEKAQQEAALPAKLNATIKDRYFTSACASPATVFPVLMRLSQHHISKAEYGYAIDNRIAKIMASMEIDNQPFPNHLSLDQQGIFILGYYHQREAFYVPKNSITAGNDTTTDNQ